LQANQYKIFLNELPIIIDFSLEQKKSEYIYDIALSNTLTVYDAAYLDLALLLNIPLATFDKALIQSAHNLGLQTL
jgi:predicted nucleic acid-binding protein